MSNSVAIYEVQGEYVVAVNGVWLPGVYASALGAAYAVRLDDALLLKLRESRYATGRPIYLDDLVAIRDRSVRRMQQD